MDIRARLISLAEEPFAKFQARLIPSLSPSVILGIRTPRLREEATCIWKTGDYEDFLNDLPHRYFEENNLHAFILEKFVCYGECLKRVNAFLPYVDNWATCDQMNPKAFAHRPELVPEIEKYLKSGHTYTVRFGMNMLMKHFLDELFDPKYPELVASVKSDDYYVKMMIAWYFATALCKQYDAAVPYIEEHRLAPDVLRMTVKKANESYRIPDEIKAKLKSMISSGAV